MIKDTYHNAQHCAEQLGHMGDTVINSITISSQAIVLLWTRGFPQAPLYPTATPHRAFTVVMQFAGW